MKEAVVFTNEKEFRRWFEKNLSIFGIKEIFLSQEVCPDYVVIMEDGHPAKVEAELFAVNFKYHGHDPAKADFIVACYSKTDEVEGVPVKAIHRLWCFDAYRWTSSHHPILSIKMEATLLTRYSPIRRHFLVCPVGWRTGG